MRKKRADLCKFECQCDDDTVTRDMSEWRQMHDGVGYSWRFTAGEMYDARCHSEDDHRHHRGTCSIEEVGEPFAGIEGLLGFDLSTIMKVGKEVHSGNLCRLWLRQAVLAAADLPE